MTLTIEEMRIITENINSQEGRQYPCSNQTVVCGIFTTRDRFEEIAFKSRNRIIKRTRDELWYANEHWIFFDKSKPYNARGYRFYKLKVDSDIDKKTFLENIYPYCSLYCKEIEFM